MASRGKKSEFKPGSLGTPEINWVANIPHQIDATATPLTISKNRKRPWRRSGVLAQRILPTRPSPFLDVAHHIWLCFHRANHNHNGF